MERIGANDVTVEDIEFVVDQGPRLDEDSYSGSADLIVAAYVTFTLRGETLTRFLGVQKRTLDNALDRLKRDRATRKRLLIRLANPPSGRPTRAVDRVTQQIGQALKREVAYELDLQERWIRRFQVGTSENYDHIAAVRVSPRDLSVTFVDVEYEGYGEAVVG